MDKQDRTTREFLANVPAIDYLTLTTFEGTAWVHWKGIMERLSSVERKEKHIPRYSGFEWVGNGGGGFIGGGIQKHMDHLILRLWGKFAADVDSEKSVRKGVLEHWAKCKRIDVQITCTEPDDWSQWRLYNRLKKRGFLVSDRSSYSGYGGRELTTIYIGSRNSESLVRVYQKEGKGGEKFLRFEYEMKEAKAKAVYSAICRGEVEVGSLLTHRLQKVGDRKLSSIFETALSNYEASDVKPERVVKSHNRTEKWLLDSVLPSFSRIINDHDADGYVLDAFYDEIMRAKGWTNGGYYEQE